MSDEYWEASEQQNRCEHPWPLIEPNAEDLANGRTHVCRLWPGHDGDHLCACGARPGDD